MHESTDERIDTYKDNARKARARANADHRSADTHSARFQGGQPILIGHHSEKSARRDRSRSDAAMRRALKNEEAAKYWENKAKAAERRQKQKHDPGVINRRIARLEAEQRRITRLRPGAEEKGHTPHAEKLDSRATEVAEQLERNRAELEESGAKVWSRDDFSKGDYALHDGTWYEIKRVNAKTVTIASLIGEDRARLRLGRRRVYRIQDNPYTWTDTLSYAKITGRISAQDMNAKMPQ